MKKVVIAFVAGLLVMASGQVVADTISQIGKKVDSEAVVILDGKNLSNAIIIQGKSYAPVRDIAEAFGGEVLWEKGVITIISENGGSISISEASLVELLQQKKTNELRIASLERKISDIAQKDVDLLAMYEDDKKSKAGDTSAIEAIDKKIAEVMAERETHVKTLNVELETLKKETRVIENRIKELESAK